MATVGGLTNSTSNNIRGYGGLASGMDRDTLIEGMTYGTTSKITQQEQKKQQLEWKQNAVRAISDMMIAFANKYTDSYTSATNLFSSMFWGRNNITTSGANSKFVSVTGTASAADAITIMGVKQLAQDAKWSSSQSVTNKVLQSGKFGEAASLLANGDYEVQNLVGKTLDFEYGGSTYSVTLGLTKPNGDLYDYKTADDIVEAVNAQLGNVKVDDNTNLSGLVKLEVQGGKIVASNGDKLGTNTIKMTGGSNSAAALLGFTTDDKLKEWEDDITRSASLKSTGLGSLTSTQTFAQKVGGKTLTFSYNGTTKTIEMPSADKLTGTAAANIDTIKEHLQTELNKAFGSGRITVDKTANEEFTFTTTNPKDGTADTTSTLTLVSGHSDLIGKNGVLGMKAGVTNRVNLNEEWAKSGLNLSTNQIETGSIEINGETFNLKEYTSMNALMNAINKSAAGVTVSYQTAGDKFTFTSKEKGASGTIEISANDPDLLKNLFGASKEDVEKLSSKNGVQGQDAIVAVKYQGSDDVVELIRDSNSFSIDGLSVGIKGEFGYKDVETTENVQALAGKELTFKVHVNGKDEEVTLKLPEPKDGEISYKNTEDIKKALEEQLQKTEVGETGRKLSEFVSIDSQKWLQGKGEITLSARDSSVTVGLTGGDALELLGLSTSDNIGSSGIKGEVDESKLISESTTTVKEYDNSTEEVKINAQVDTDKIVDSIKSMVEEYNKIIELVNKEVSTRPDRDYAPLTSEQKKELSESEIETWEEKAKSGMLYGDSDLRSLSSDLRFIISGGNMEALRKIGITTSTLYSDNGKLTLDETKLRAALETDPESVEKLFTTAKGTKDEKGNDISGIATNLKSVMDKYVKTLGSMETKGILIKKAGSTSSPMSLTENAFYKQLAEINKQISKLQTRLESERDRYIKQFTSLETLISQMNSQSSWLSQLGGY